MTHEWKPAPPPGPDPSKGPGWDNAPPVKAAPKWGPLVGFVVVVLVVTACVYLTGSYR